MLLVLTESCSMGCTHCMDRAVPCDRHLTEETLRDAVHFLTINQAAMHICVTGGEPTEHPRFVDMMGIIIDTLDKNGQPCAVTITSNGFWCLEHQEEAKRIAKGTKNVHVFWQISTDTRYYPKTLPTHKRLWREDGFVLCTDCVQNVYPQGRAKDNNLPWKARASKCFNLRAITKQMPNPSIGLIVESLLTKGFFCTPAIGIDGSIRLGESFLCPKVTSIYEPEEVIIQKIKDFKCHQCDEINNQLPEIYHQFL